MPPVADRPDHQRDADPPLDVWLDDPSEPARTPSTVLRCCPAMRLAPPTLTGQHVALEPISHEHVPGLVAAASVDRRSYGYTNVPDGEAAMLEYVDALRRDAAAETAVPFAQVRRADGQVVGCTRFLDVRWWPGRSNPVEVEIGGTWLAADAQRTPINTEAKLLLLGARVRRVGRAPRGDLHRRAQRPAAGRRSSGSAPPSRACCAGTAPRWARPPRRARRATPRCTRSSPRSGRPCARRWSGGSVVADHRPVVLVTGASRGIGAAVVLAAAADVRRRREPHGDGPARGRGRGGGGGARARARVLVHAADVADEAAVVDMFARIDDELGPVAGLVNNAGIAGAHGTLEVVDAAMMARLLAVNVTGAFLCAREAVRADVDRTRRHRRLDRQRVVEGGRARRRHRVGALRGDQGRDRHHDRRAGDASSRARACG